MGCSPPHRSRSTAQLYRPGACRCGGPRDGDFRTAKVSIEQVLSRSSGGTTYGGTDNGFRLARRPSSSDGGGRRGGKEAATALRHVMDRLRTSESRPVLVLRSRERDIEALRGSCGAPDGMNIERTHRFLKHEGLRDPAKKPKIRGLGILRNGWKRLMSTHVDHERYDFVWDQTEESRRLPPCRTRGSITQRGIQRCTGGTPVLFFWGRRRLAERPRFSPVRTSG